MMPKMKRAVESSFSFASARSRHRRASSRRSQQIALRELRRVVGEAVHLFDDVLILHEVLEGDVGLTCEHQIDVPDKLLGLGEQLVVEPTGDPEHVLHDLLAGTLRDLPTDFVQGRGSLDQAFTERVHALSRVDRHGAAPWRRAEGLNA